MNITAALRMAEADDHHRRWQLGAVAAFVAAGHVGMLTAWLGPSLAKPTEGGLVDRPANRRVDLWYADAEIPSSRLSFGTGVTTPGDSLRTTFRRRPAVERSRPPGAESARTRTPPPSGEPMERVAAPQPLETSAHFYTFDEVDIPATPTTDWELNAATLDSAGIPRIVFDLFVSDDGSVVACSIVQPAEMDAAVRLSLESRLRSTAFLPATRTGRPVNSMRRIELFVS